MAALATGWTKVRERDDDAFERLFAAEYSKVVAIAHRVLADAHEAEDVAQDVFYAFHRHHAPNAPYAAAWLHRAAAHTALNVIRGRRRRRSREMAESIEASRLHAGSESFLDPQRVVEQREQAQLVRSGLARLSTKSASVLVLRHSGLSYPEVALALGVKTNQVGTLLRRAEEALRKEMNRETLE